jgi:TrpR-related protein YerC/YecD
MNWQDPSVQALVTALQHVRSYEDMRRFLADLCTEAEIELLAKRFQAADMLSEAIPYKLIARETGLSSATIAKVASKMSRGEGGLILALLRIAPLPPHRNQRTEQA